MTVTSNPARRVTKHTAGPWSVTWVQGNHFTEQQHLNFPDGSGVPLGSLSEADAHLISAAPELYEACRELLKIVMTDLYKADRQSFVRQASGAIARAEGREP